MKINFTTNDYLLTWNILFGASISLDSQQVKEKLWTTYKDQYNNIENDKDELLRDFKNFIPDDDTIYNLMFDTSLFKNVRENARKNRRNIMQVYDHNKKKIDDYLNAIFKSSIDDVYNVLVMDPNMDCILKTKTNKTIGWGKREDVVDYNRTLTKILKRIISIEVGQVDDKYRVLKEAVLELAIDNEFFTRFSGKSSYDEGHKAIVGLKRQIYPYWLMYLGIKKEDFTSYMMRDKIAFEVDNYEYDKNLKKANLREFVDFCIENQKTILKYFRPQMIERQKEIKVNYDNKQSQKEYQAIQDLPKQEYQYIVNSKAVQQNQQLEII